LDLNLFDHYFDADIHAALHCTAFVLFLVVFLTFLRVSFYVFIPGKKDEIIASDRNVIGLCNYNVSSVFSEDYFWFNLKIRISIIDNLSPFEITNDFCLLFLPMFP
jgi:hypothetical protein